MALQRNTCSRYPGIKDSMNADCLGWVYYLPCHLGASPLSWVQLLIHTVWRLVPCFHSPPNSTLGQKPFHILSFFLTLFNIALFPVKTRLHPSGRASAQAILSENPWWGMQHRGPQTSLKPSQWTETQRKSQGTLAWMTFAIPYPNAQGQKCIIFGTSFGFWNISIHKKKKKDIAGTLVQTWNSFMFYIHLKIIVYNVGNWVQGLLCIRE